MLSPLCLVVLSYLTHLCTNSLPCRDLVSGAGGAAGGLVPSDPFPQRDRGAEVPSGSAQVRLLIHAVAGLNPARNTLLGTYLEVNAC